MLQDCQRLRAGRQGDIAVIFWSVLDQAKMDTWFAATIAEVFAAYIGLYDDDFSQRLGRYSLKSYHF